MMHGTTNIKTVSVHFSNSQTNIAAVTAFPEKKFFDAIDENFYMGKLVREMEKLGSFFDPCLNFDPK